MLAATRTPVVASVNAPAVRLSSGLLYRTVTSLSHVPRAPSPRQIHHTAAPHSILSKVPRTAPTPSPLESSVPLHNHGLTTTGLRLSSITLQNQLIVSSPTHRTFSTTPTRPIDLVHQPKDPQKIFKTDATWPHPGYTEDQMRNMVHFEHRHPKDLSDRFALFLMRILRIGTDFLTGYHHDDLTPSVASDSKAVVSATPYRMSERKWLIRFIFLESVAAVPGMVGGMLRHLHSLRRMKRDQGWIETLLEEAYNERMHLLTFLKMANPGWFMRMMCLGAQGVFFNSLFFSYLISPRTVHRFVGYLEEEAVLTYSLVLEDIEAGKLPGWDNLLAPDIAIDYWKMPEGKRTMKDLILYVRADEAKHREVNHTLSNLIQAQDPNPFVSQYNDDSKPHPSKGISPKRYKGTGWERDEVVD
jgi:hypothetical protein